MHIQGFYQKFRTPVTQSLGKKKKKRGNSPLTLPTTVLSTSRSSVESGTPFLDRDFYRYGRSILPGLNYY